MARLTIVDNYGNWGLRNGYPMMKVPGELYGCLCKLKDYEDICDNPEKLENIDDLYLAKCEEVNKLNAEIQKLKEENRQIREKSVTMKTFKVCMEGKRNESTAN